MVYLKRTGKKHKKKEGREWIIKKNNKMKRTEIILQNTK